MSGFQGEIGRIFTIEDRATPTLDRIAARLEAIDDVATTTEASLNRLGALDLQGAVSGANSLYTALDRLNTVDIASVTSKVQTFATNVQDIGAAVELLPDAFEQAAARINAAFDDMISRAVTLRDSMSAMGLGGEGPNFFTLSSSATAGAYSNAEAHAAAMADARAAAMGVAGAYAFGGGPGGGGGSPGGGGRGGGHGRGFGGRLMDVLMKPSTLIEGFAVGESLHLAATEDLAIQNSMMFLGQAGRRANPQMYKELTADVAAGAAGTIYSQTKVADALEAFSQIIASGLRGTPEQKMHEMMALFPGVLRTAEVAQQQGLGPIDENVAALSAFPHMLGVYDPAKMQPYMDALLKVSEISHVSLREMEGALKYIMPVANVVGANPMEMIQSVGFLSRAGITGTTAGTGLARVLLGDLLAGASTGSSRYHSESARRQLYDSLHLEPGARHQYETAARSNARTRAAHELGILTPGGQNVTMDAQGHINFDKLLEVLDKAARTLDPHKFQQDLEKVFLVYGLRAIDMFLGPEHEQQLAIYRRYEEGLPGGVQQQLTQAQTPLQEFQQMIARTKDVMATLALDILPELGSAAQHAADALETINQWLEKHERTGSIIAGAATGAAVGATIGSVVPVIGTGAGALLGAGAGAGIAIVHDHDLDHVVPMTTPGQMGPHPSTLIHPQSYIIPQGGTHIHIEQISLHGGSTRDMVDELVEELAHRLGDSQMNNLGPGAGIAHSPFASGATVSV